MLLSNKRVSEEIKNKIQKFLNANENVHTRYQNLWDTAKAVLRLWEAEAGGSRGRDQPGQHSETASLLKIQKKFLGVVARACIPCYSGG